MGQIENAARLPYSDRPQHQRKAHDDEADVRGRQDHLRSRLGADLAELVQEADSNQQKPDLPEAAELKKHSQVRPDLIAGHMLEHPLEMLRFSLDPDQLKI
jgi:hypothetical protein